MNTPDYATYKAIFAHTPQPFAFVNLDLLDKNIAQVLGYSGQKFVRVASKSVRCVALLRHILNSDARFRGLMCFTAAEAVYLAQQGFDDLLVAYPTWEPGQITAVTEMVRNGHRITLMVDSREHVPHINAIARTEGVRLPLCLDIDMSTRHFGSLHFGVWRSAVQTAEQALAVVAAVQDSSHVYLDGLMGYEAQIAGVADNLPGSAVMNRLLRFLKRRALPQVIARRQAVVQAVQAAGVTLRFVNGGGSGSLKSSGGETAVTEVTAGSAFYAPSLFTSYADYDYYPAAAFAIQIVRRPRPNIYTCLGGGYIASGDAGADRLPRPFLPADARLLPFEGAGEVQTPIRYDGPQPLTLGDPIFMRHAKAGELCERFNDLHLIANNQIVNTVKTYRGEGCGFL